MGVYLPASPSAHKAWRKVFNHPSYSCSLGAQGRFKFTARWSYTPQGESSRVRLYGSDVILIATRCFCFPALTHSGFLL